MLKRKRGLCLRHFIAWVIYTSIAYFFASIVIFFFFKAIKALGRTNLWFVSDIFRQIKIRHKNFKKKKKKEFPKRNHQIDIHTLTLFVWLVKNKPHFSKKKNHAPFLFKGRSRHDHNNIIFTYLKT